MSEKKWAPATAGALSGHLAFVIESVRVAPISSECSKIDDLTVFPNDRIVLRQAGCGIDAAVFRDSSDHSVIVDVIRAATVDARKRA
jgi:hypothetical protein